MNVDVYCSDQPGQDPDWDWVGREPDWSAADQRVRGSLQHDVQPRAVATGKPGPEVIWIYSFGNQSYKLVGPGPGPGAA